MDPVVVEKPAEKQRRPKYVEKGEHAPQDQHKTDLQHEHHDKREQNKQKRRQRREKEKDEHEDEEYNIKAEDINENTVVPKLPKKNQILKQPDQTQYKNRETDIINKIKAAKQKRAKILAEKYEPGKKGQQGKFDEFDKMKEEVVELKKIKEEAFKQLEQIKNKIKDTQDEITEIDEEINSYGGKGGKSENIFEKLKRVENELLTKKLTPKEEKDLTHERDTLRRTVNNATSKISSENIEVRLDQLREKKKTLTESLHDLYDEKKPIHAKYMQAKQKYTPVNEKVNAIRLERKNQKQTEKTEFDQGRNQFNEKKTQKKDNIDNQIDKLRDSIEDLWDEFHRKIKEHRKQERFIKHVEWLTRKKQNYIKHKEWEKRQKEIQERQKEAPVVKPKKYTNHIKNCETLIEYCRKINPTEDEQKEKTQAQQKLSIEEIQNKLSEDSQWKKEKGVTLIQSKKTQDLDVQIGGKKNRKNKKVEVQQQKDGKVKKPTIFAHDIGIRNAFEDVKVLCPDTPDDLQKTIQSLQEKLAQYNKMNDQQEPQQKKQENRQQQKTEKQVPKKKQEKQTKLEIKEQDFPSI